MFFVLNIYLSDFMLPQEFGIDSVAISLSITKSYFPSSLVTSAPLYLKINLYFMLCHYCFPFSSNFINVLECKFVLDDCCFSFLFFFHPRLVVVGCLFLLIIPAFHICSHTQSGIRQTAKAGCIEDKTCLFLIDCIYFLWSKLHYEIKS